MQHMCSSSFILIEIYLKIEWDFTWILANDDDYHDVRVMGSTEYSTSKQFGNHSFFHNANTYFRYKYFFFIGALLNISVLKSSWIVRNSLAKTFEVFPYDFISFKKCALVLSEMQANGVIMIFIVWLKLVTNDRYQTHLR